VREQRRGILSIDGKHSLLPLIREVTAAVLPKRRLYAAMASQKVLVSRVGRDVPDDEIANIDGGGPVPRPKAAPTIAGIGLLP
jgi:hypothetical protein